MKKTSQDKSQRRLVKESFIIDSSDGKRKLRHIFLFNDILVCAKYKPSTRQKFTFDVKWYALLSDVTLPGEDGSPANVSSKEREVTNEIMSIKTRLSSLRDSMISQGGSTRALEKLKKKQAELEGQLVLLLPQLPLSLSVRSKKSEDGRWYHFFLSSEYEKTQWIESIRVLQQTASSSDTPPSGKEKESASSINIHELQAWIDTCSRKGGLHPNLGSFLLRSLKDEELLHGDLYLEILSLKGLSRPADLFFTLEVDNYGHFFQKQVTKVAKDSTELVFDQEFVLDLDGSQTLRILCYENVPGHPSPLFRGKASVELSRSWLTDTLTPREISILDSILIVRIKFISCESSTLRFPAGKVYGSFGVSIQTVCK